MKRTHGFLIAGSSLLAVMTSASAQHAMMTDKELIDELSLAAPSDLVKGATIMNKDANGKMTTVQEGTNGWTCMDPGGAPMCADKAAMEWVEAWRSKGPEPQKLGFIYMLKGDDGASNTDPYAVKEAPDNHWIKTGPHVMIVGAAAKAMMQGYPRDAKADPNKPYVMWPGTRYEHLMLPVK